MRRSYELERTQELMIVAEELIRRDREYLEDFYRTERDFLGQFKRFQPLHWSCDVKTYRGRAGAVAARCPAITNPAQTAAELKITLKRPPQAL